MLTRARFLGPLILVPPRATTRHMDRPYIPFQPRIPMTHCRYVWQSMNNLKVGNEHILMLVYFISGLPGRRMSS